MPHLPSTSADRTRRNDDWPHLVERPGWPRIPGGFPPRPIGGLDATFARESVVLLIRNKRGHCIVSPLMAGAGSKGT
jgi:hypothetical protein